MRDRDSRTRPPVTRGANLKLSTACLFFEANQNQVSRIDSCVGLLLKGHEVEDRLPLNDSLGVFSRQLYVSMPRLDTDGHPANK